MRRYSIDELPQLWNVVRADMSLVGPQPERVSYVEHFETAVYRYRDRHRVKSGLTGWAQVSGLRGTTSLADRIEWDNHYIENWSPWLDVKILLKTLVAVGRDPANKPPNRNGELSVNRRGYRELVPLLAIGSILLWAPAAWGADASVAPEDPTASAQTAETVQTAQVAEPAQSPNDVSGGNEYTEDGIPKGTGEDNSSRPRNPPAAARSPLREPPRARRARASRARTPATRRPPPPPPPTPPPCPGRVPTAGSWRWSGSGCLG